ncbi:vacuolar transporter chaperone 1 [Colletotrichum asianum]|uniref:Vacuolar transporter chaperone 1 n=1 Tax=Colletotrichum asianum TaxID=702518 RepID=A0A8H3WM17_9PEZI|nr:vacuolar transporter chaperone 1 [Colletotrichum asianum]
MSSQPLLQTAPGMSTYNTIPTSRAYHRRERPSRRDLQLTTAALDPGKRIALPTRVEPKVFFANERTFLSWLNFTVILGALAIGMLNFGDRPAFISAFLFTGVAMLTMIYALATYHWRAKSIRVRGQAGFDDRFGPTFLAIILLLAVVVNFVLRITYSSKESKH